MYGKTVDIMSAPGMLTQQKSVYLHDLILIYA